MSEYKNTVSWSEAVKAKNRLNQEFRQTIFNITGYTVDFVFLLELNEDKARNGDKPLQIEVVFQHTKRKPRNCKWQAIGLLLASEMAKRFEYNGYYVQD